MENKNIIIVGLQDWDTAIGSNCKNIALEFAKNNRVLYVNYPLDMITMVRERKNPNIKKRIEAIKNGKLQIEQVDKNIWSFYPSVLINSINWISSPKIYDSLNRRNNKKFASEIKKAASELGFTDYILFNDNDIFRSLYLKEYLEPTKSIYYIRDFLLSVPYWKKHGKRLEPQLISKSNYVVTNSVYLKNYAAKNNINSFYVGQGCEIDLFDPSNDYPKPAELHAINKPIVGYIGMLASLRLDIELLVYIAEKLPQMSFVFVGPEDDNFKESKLHTMNNVHFFGSREVAKLPNYLSHFDVCINPQLVNDVTIGNYPRKVDEYLAMGKPVVATKTEAMGVFEHHTYLASGKEEFASKILRALTEDQQDLINKRIEFAKAHTWQNSVQEIYNAVESEVEFQNA
jgi:glycosyltransferase involved in cell wall biosynthesis